jgi:hypothetical protein
VCQHLLRRQLHPPAEQARQPECPSLEVGVGPAQRAGPARQQRNAREHSRLRGGWTQPLSRRRDAGPGARCGGALRPQLLGNARLAGERDSGARSPADRGRGGPRPHRAPPNVRRAAASRTCLARGWRVALRSTSDASPARTASPRKLPSRPRHVVSPGDLRPVMLMLHENGACRRRPSRCVVTRR